MTHMEIVALYVAINLIILPVLMFRVGQIRQAQKVSLGDGDSMLLLSRIRAHGNFAETTPFALLGLFALAGLNASVIALHIFGAGFTIGRLLHAQGMAADGHAGTGRVIGAILSLLTFLGIGFYLLYLIFAA